MGITAACIACGALHNVNDYHEIITEGFIYLKRKWEIIKIVIVARNVKYLQKH